MTTVIKCNSCNIVIDEMLSYIQNKVSVIDEDTLIRICKSSFRGDEIKKSKSLLFESLSTTQRKILRKNKGKEERDLADIINLLKSAEPDEIPVFVARQLEKLPPITFDHLDCSKLLKDIVRMQTTIDDMKSNYATLDNLTELKAELLQIKNSSYQPASAFRVNKNRGAWLLNSGPMGLSDMHNSSLNESYNCNNSETNKKTPQNKNIPRVDMNQFENDSQMHLAASGACVETGSLPGSAQGSSPVHKMNQLTALKDVNKSVTMERTNILCENTVLTADVHDDRKCEGWQQVTYRKKQPKYRYLGKSGVAKDSECNFKAAEKKVSVFITNIHNDTTEEDIIKYIYSKTNENVSLEKILMKKEKGHKAFRFFVSESRLSLYLDENLWPRNIVFRRFMNFKHRKSNRYLSVDGPTTHKNE